MSARRKNTSVKGVVSSTSRNGNGKKVSTNTTNKRIVQRQIDSDSDCQMTPDTDEEHEHEHRSSMKVQCSIDYKMEEGGAPVFRPSSHQFEDFAQFIENVNEVGAKYGFIKVIPPEGWTPSKSAYQAKKIQELLIQSPVRQNVTCVQGLDGAFRVLNVEETRQEPVPVSQFEALSVQTEALRSVREKRYAEEKDYEALAAKFWSTTLSNFPLYGADSPGTLFDPECKEWNVGNLPSLLHALPGDGIPGVSLPFLYWGQWKSMFAWHIEDVNLYSINYLHQGAPKQWYAIAPEHRAKFDSALAQIWPIDKRACSEFIRHKEYLVSPTRLKRLGVPFMQTRQERGQFIVLWPQCYHQGFNYGFNCAESVNFATSFWTKSTLQKDCNRCLCRSDTVWVQPKKIMEMWRVLQYLHRKEREKKAAGKLLTVQDVPSSYQLDDSSIWLGLPTIPQELHSLSERYYSVNDGASNGGRSMAGRSMTGVSSGASVSSSSHAIDSSSSKGFLFDETKYNEMGTASNAAGFGEDANAVHCTYEKCPKPIHRNALALAKHFKDYHSKEGQERLAKKNAHAAAAASSSMTHAIPFPMFPGYPLFPLSGNPHSFPTTSPVSSTVASHAKKAPQKRKDTSEESSEEPQRKKQNTQKSNKKK